MKILFICSGNTCRSPMAEQLMNSLCRRAGLDLQCESAGLSAFSGDSASQGSILAMKKRDIDLSGHRARRFSDYMEQEYDLFVAMTEAIGQMLCSRIEKQKLFCYNIRDPYGMSEADYKDCAEEIEGANRRLLLSLARLEKMSSEHISQLAALEKICFSEPWSPESLRQELSNDKAHFLVCTLAGKAAGYIGMHCILDEAYITNVAVFPELRGIGIGNLLIEGCVKNAQSLGCSFLSLEVRKSNKGAISLYEKNGFLTVGERKGFYSSPTEDGLIMTRVFDKE